MKKSSRLRSLKVSDGFRSFVIGQLEALGGLVPKSMFGGVGLYSNGLFFGIVAGDVLYLKADDVNRSDFEQAGARPFQPYRDRAGTMTYYAVPVGVLESEPELLEWARKAVEAADRAATAPRARPRPKPGSSPRSRARGGSRTRSRRGR